MESVAKLKFEGGVHSWEIEAEVEVCERIDKLWQEKYKDSICPVRKPKIEYGVSASGRRVFSIEYDDDNDLATTVLQIARQLAGGPIPE